MQARRRAVFMAVLAALFPLTAAIASGPERREQGNLVIEGIPEIPAEVEERLDRYQNIRSASLEGWHPAGKGVLVTTRFGETTQVHWVREPGGARTQVTFFDEPVAGADVSPVAATDGFLFGKDVGGSENYQLFYFDLATGAYRRMTDGTSRNVAARWSHGGRRFVFSTTRRNGTDWDLHVADVGEPGKSTALLEESGAWFAADWSPDDTRLVVARYVSANESYPYVLDLETGALTRIDPGDERVSYDELRFTADGKGVLFTSDRDSEFRRLRLYDIATGETRVLTPDIDWSVERVAVSDDGRYLAFTVNEEGFSRLHVRDLADGVAVAVPDLPAGLVYGLEFSPKGHRLGMVLDTPRSPGDVYDLDLDTLELTRWTFSEVGGLSEDGFVVPELIRYPTFDRVDGTARTIPAYYYRPRGDGPFAVVVDIHGGPEGQERPGFNASTQYLVRELGIAVLAPNVRGSDGYGKSYLLLDNGRLREDSVRDIGKLLEWIAGRPELDAARVAVMGGSYGGYMSLASMVHYSDRLRAGITVVGISNFVTFLENTQDYRRDLRRAEYGDERDPGMREFLLGISPLTRAGKITVPMLVVQGLNDPRVPYTESEQIVETVRGNGGDVWYLLARDEGHGFRKKSNRDYYTAAVSLFLERHLLRPPDDLPGEP